MWRKEIDKKVSIFSYEMPKHLQRIFGQHECSQSSADMQDHSNFYAFDLPDICSLLMRDEVAICDEILAERMEITHLDSHIRTAMPSSEV